MEALLTPANRASVLALLASSGQWSSAPTGFSSSRLQPVHMNQAADSLVKPSMAQPALSPSTGCAAPRRAQSYAFYYAGLLASASLLALAAAELARAVRNARARRATRGMPGEQGYPVVGETLAYGDRMRAFQDARFAEHGPVFRTNILGADVVFIGVVPGVDPADMLDLVFSDGQARHGIEHAYLPGLDRFARGTLVAMSGAEHARERNMVVRGLSDEQLRVSVPLLADVLEAAVARWSAAGPRGVDVKVHGKAAIWEFLQSAVCGTLPPADSVRLRRLMEDLAPGFFAVPVDLGPLSMYGRALVAKREMDHMMRDEIARRDASTSSSVDGRATDVMQAFLDYVDADSGRRMSDASIASSISLLSLATDTTASTLFSALLALSDGDDPNVVAMRAKIVDEVGRVTAGVRDARQVTLDHLNELKYTHAFLGEVLRVRPPFSQNLRLAGRDVMIPGTPYTVPKGWYIFYSHSHAQRNDAVNFAPDPHAFRPERHLHDPSHVAEWKRAVTPFAKGVHMCPGFKFALAIVKMFLVVLARRVLEGHEWPSVHMRLESEDVREIPSIEPRGELRVVFQ